MASPVYIYTDGAYSPKHNIGGWGFVVSPSGGAGAYADYECSNGVARTTNNRMEIEAILRAITFAIKNLPDAHVYIRSDSKYAVHRLRSRLDKPNVDISTIANADLILIGQSLMRSHGNITLQWIKGHAGNVYNERADKLATTARNKLVSEKTLNVKPDK